MKSKIFSLSIATLILWGSTTEPKGRIFTAAGVKAVAKLVNRMQWATLTGWAGYNLKALKDGHEGLESAADRLPNAPEWATSYVRDILADPSVIVKYDFFGFMSGGYAGALSNPFNGKKVIFISFLLPSEANYGILHHECSHIQNNHGIKNFLTQSVGPLALNTVFKTANTGFRVVRYGYAATKKHVPSIGATLLKIPTTIISAPLSILGARHQNRLFELQADNAIPADLAGPVANEFKSWLPKKQIYEMGLSTKEKMMEMLLGSHPKLQIRIPELQARAVPATWKDYMLRKLPALRTPAIILGSAALVYGGIKTYQCWNKKTAEASPEVPQETVA